MTPATRPMACEALMPEIHDDLMDLARIGQHGRQVRPDAARISIATGIVERSSPSAS